MKVFSAYLYLGLGNLLMNNVFYIIVSLLFFSEYTQANDKSIEFDVTLGAFSYLKKWDIEGEDKGVYEKGGGTFKVGVGVYKNFNESHSVGTNFDYYHDIEGASLWSVRALDYRYQLFQNWQVNSFVGAARINTGTPAHGYIIGGGLIYQLPNSANQFVQAEVQLSDKLTRDINAPDEVSRYGDIGLYLAGFHISWGWTF